MKTIVLACTFLMTPNLADNQPNPRTVISCPKWINQSDEVAPPGISVSPTQSRTNRLRCYCSIVKPLEKLCKKNYARNLCEQRTLNWLDKNFSMPGGVLNANQRQDQAYPAENLIINIRSSY
jgi:hypothetical protein